jgi:NhaP-type Na+/H+ or K+/H+ antiporter
MEIMRSRQYLAYAFASFVCPVAIPLMTVAYQSVAHAEDWKLYSEDGMYIALAEIIQIVFAIAIGSAFGLILALISVRLQRRFLSVGTAAMLFNSLPFVLSLYLIVRGMTRGW